MPAAVQAEGWRMGLRRPRRAQGGWLLPLPSALGSRWWDCALSPAAPLYAPQPGDAGVSFRTLPTPLIPASRGQLAPGAEGTPPKRAAVSRWPPTPRGCRRGCSQPGRRSGRGSHRAWPKSQKTRQRLCPPRPSSAPEGKGIPTGPAQAAGETRVSVLPAQKEERRGLRSSSTPH